MRMKEVHLGHKVISLIREIIVLGIVGSAVCRLGYLFALRLVIWFIGIYWYLLIIKVVFQGTWSSSAKRIASFTASRIRFLLVNVRKDCACKREYGRWKMKKVSITPSMRGFEGGISLPILAEVSPGTAVHHTLDSLFTLWCHSSVSVHLVHTGLSFFF
jgi:hypothetical protein